MASIEDFPMKVRIMGCILERRGVFQANIAAAYEKNQGDIQHAIDTLSNSGYIEINKNPPRAIRKTVYWQIVETPGVLLKLYNDPDFVYLQDIIRTKSWIHDMVKKRFTGYPDEVLQAIPRMLYRSPSFFKVMLEHETLDQLKDYYRPYLGVRQFLTGFDETFVGCWFLYQLFVECCIKDRNAPLIAESPAGQVAGELFEALTSIGPISRQSEDIKHLQSAVHAIELTFPYWGYENRTIKESTLRNISEFNARCAEANLLPPLDERDHALYYATFLNILHNLAMDQYGDPLEPM